MGSVSVCMVFCGCSGFLMSWGSETSATPDPVLPLFHPAYFNSTGSFSLTFHFNSLLLWPHLDLVQHVNNHNSPLCVSPSLQLPPLGTSQKWVLLGELQVSTSPLHCWLSSIPCLQLTIWIHFPQCSLWTQGKFTLLVSHQTVCRHSWCLSTKTSACSTVMVELDWCL